MNFLKFFRDEEEASLKEDLGAASNIMEFSRQPYYEEFIAWLEQESFKQIEVNENHMEMVKGAVRANTMRAIRDHLMLEVRRAENLLKAVNEDS